MGWSLDPGPPIGGEFPAIFIVIIAMKKRQLSIFIDESGDFGRYDSHCPYYFVTMVMHNQNVDITPELERLKNQVAVLGMEKHAIHAGPIIRREVEYKHIERKERQIRGNICAP